MLYLYKMKNHDFEAFWCIKNEKTCLWRDFHLYKMKKHVLKRFVYKILKRCFWSVLHLYKMKNLVFWSDFHVYKMIETRFPSVFHLYKMKKHDSEALFMSKWKKDAFAFKNICELLGAEDIPSAPTLRKKKTSKIV